MSLPFRGMRGGSEPPRIAALDTLRGIAILSVVVFHAFVIHASSRWWWMRFIGQGAEGVGLFFILSAFTLGLSWDYRKAQGQPMSYWAFWARRFWRIAPLYYVVLALSALCTHGNLQFASPSMGNNPFTWGSLVAHMTFVFGWIPAYQNSWIGVEWSIGAEMTFYALFPGIVQKVLPRIKPEGLVAVGLSMIWVWPMVMTHIPGVTWPGWADAFLLWSFPRQFIWFALGLWLWKRHNLLKLRHWGWAVVWLAMAAVIANTVWKNPRNEMLVWLVPNVFLVWLSSHDAFALRWMIHNRFLDYIGKRSYSLYLIHWVVLQAIVLPFVPYAHMGGVKGLVIRVFAMLPLSIALSAVSYRYIEQPGIRYGKMWLQRHVVPSQRAIDRGNLIFHASQKRISR